MTWLQSQEGEGRWLAVTLRSAAGLVKAVSYPYLIDAACVRARFGFVQQTHRLLVLDPRHTSGDLVYP